MITIFARTVLIYFFLVIFMRIMGKRQVGELELSELVSTLLLSEIATIPIENSDIPLSNMVIPLLLIISLEIMLSFATTKSDMLKRFLSGKPSVLIKRGEIDISELEKTRLSVEELASELRLKGIGSIEDVEYAMLEQNGQISVIPKKASSPLTPKDASINAPEDGIAHILIVDGHIKEANLLLSGKSHAWLDAQLANMKKNTSDVFLFTVDDREHINIIYKGSKRK